MINIDRSYPEPKSLQIEKEKRKMEAIQMMML